MASALPDKTVTADSFPPASTAKITTGIRRCRKMAPVAVPIGPMDREAIHYH